MKAKHNIDVFATVLRSVFLSTAAKTKRFPVTVIGQSRPLMIHKRIDTTRNITEGAKGTILRPIDTVCSQTNLSDCSVPLLERNPDFILSTCIRKENASVLRDETIMYLIQSETVNINAEAIYLCSRHC